MAEMPMRLKMSALVKMACFLADSKFSQIFLFTILIHTFAKNKAKRPFGL